MDIGKQERVITVEPEPLKTPLKTPERKEPAAPIPSPSR